MKKTFYSLIYERMLQRIRGGEFDNGQRLPTETELAKEFDVSRITSKRAYEMLEQEGYIVRFPKKGTFVSNEGTNAIERKVSGSGNSLIGVVFPDYNFCRKEFFEPLYSSLNDADLHCLIECSKNNQAKETEIIRRLLAIGIDGLIISPAEAVDYNHELIRLAIAKFPVVLLDKTLDGTGLSSVCSDYRYSGRLAAEYLLKKGHKNICFLTDNVEYGSIDAQALDGYKDACIEQKNISATNNVFCFCKEDFVSNQNGKPTSKSSENVSVTDKPDKNKIVSYDTVRLEEFLIKSAISGAVCLNQTISLTLNQAVKRLSASVETISVDYSDAICAYIKRKDTEIARTAVSLLIQHLSGESPNKTIRIAPNQISNQN